MIVICDISALRLHAAYGRRLKPLPSHEPVIPTLSEEDLSSIDIRAFEERFGRLHAVIGGRHLRRNLSGITSHTCSAPLPASSLMMLKRGVGVASVGLCAALMSRTLGDLQLARLLYELCAIYRVEDYRTACDPLASVTQLERELEPLSAIRGAGRVLGLLPYIADRSRSPRETDLAMLAWLPHRMGGYGLPVGTMNEQRRLGGITRRCDLLFPPVKGMPRLGVEYESDEEHSGEADISHDSARRKLFENKGYRIVTFTNGELRNGNLSYEAMRFIGKCLGLRVRRPRGGNVARREELLRFINTAHVPFF